jgi:hypothetical protein
VRKHGSVPWVPEPFPACALIVSLGMPVSIGAFPHTFSTTPDTYTYHFRNDVFTRFVDAS